MLSAKADLAKVQQMIDQGQWDQAEDQLAAVSSVVQSMNDGPDRHALMDQVNLLNVRVESRNPNATLPPPAASTTSPVWSAPTSTAQSAVPTTSQPSPSQSASPSPSPSSGRHKHHGHTTSPSPAVGITNP